MTRRVAGQLHRNKASAMQREVHKSLRTDRDMRTKSVGEMISHELAGGNVECPRGFPPLKRVVLVCDLDPSTPVFPDHGLADCGTD